MTTEYSSSHVAPWRIGRGPFLFAVATFMTMLVMFQLLDGNEDLAVARQIAVVEADENREVVFYQSIHADRTLERLKPIPNLEAMIFELTDISDAGLRELAKQPNLERIKIIGGSPGVGDENLKHLAGLEHLITLELENQRVTDKGLKVLSGLQGLRSLELLYDRGDQYSPLSDAALDTLATCTQLQRLTLGGTWFSDPAVERLRQRLPSCAVKVLPYGRRAEGVSVQDNR